MLPVVLLHSFVAAECPVMCTASLSVHLSLGIQVVSMSRFSSAAQSCPALCNPVGGSVPGLPVHHRLLEPAPQCALTGLLLTVLLCAQGCRHLLEPQFCPTFPGVGSLDLMASLIFGFLRNLLAVFRSGRTHQCAFPPAVVEGAGRGVSFSPHPLQHLLL